MSNYPSLMNDTSTSRLVTVDSMFLHIMNDSVQGIYIASCQLVEAKAFIEIGGEHDSQK